MVRLKYAFYEADMKYFSILNIEYDYDDIESTEVLVFSAPDAFKFNLDVTKAYCDFRKWKYKEEFLTKGKHPIKYLDIEIDPKSKKTQFWRLNGLHDILEYNNDERKELIEWLRKKQKVKLLPTIEI